MMILNNKKQSLLRFVFVYFVILFMSILVTFVLLTKMYESHTLNQEIKTLNGYLLSTKELLNSNKIDPSQWCETLSPKTFVRYTLLKENGDIMCDSFTKNTLENHSERTEIKMSQTGEFGFATRFSNTTKMKMIYSVIHLPALNGQQYLLRAGVPVNEISLLTTSNILYAGFLLITLSLFIGFFLFWYSKKERQKEIELVNRVKQDLMANISHELRTPLTAIKGYAQFLLASKIPNELKLPLSKIEYNSTKLSDIFSDILDISMIENINDLNLEEISLSDMIKSILSSVQREISEKNITIELLLKSDLFLSDARLLDRILTNLIINAVKYSDCGKIIITSSQEAKSVVISIRDNGIGIDQREHEKIFERFYRINSEESNKRRGSGLGLSIVKNAILKLDGSIQLESEIGKGALFTIKVPVQI